MKTLSYNQKQLRHTLKWRMNQLQTASPEFAHHTMGYAEASYQAGAIIFSEIDKCRLVISFRIGNYPYEVKNLWWKENENG